MRGTVFGEWLESEHQQELRALKPADAIPYGSCEGYTQAPRNIRGASSGLYGIVWRPDGSASLDGACGFESMRSLAEHIGLEVSLVDAGKDRDVIIVTPKA